MSLLDSLKAGISSIGSKLSSTWGGLTGAFQTANEARPVISFASNVARGISTKNQQRVGGIFDTAIDKGASLLGNITNSLISRLTNNIDPNARELMRAQRAALAAQTAAANAQSEAAKKNILSSFLSRLSPSESEKPSTTPILSVSAILFIVAGGLAYFLFFKNK